MMKWHKTNISGNNFLFTVIVFLLSPVANMVANYIRIKYIFKGGYAHFNMHIFHF